MSLFDKFGKVAMDTLDKAAQRAREAKKHIDPLIDKTPFAAKLRDKIMPRPEEVEVPSAEVLRRPFDAPNTGTDDGPLGDPAVAAQVYGRTAEPWTGRARQLLRERAVEHQFVALDEEGGLALETRLMRQTQQHGGLYVFLRGKYIGGYHALNEIDRLGQLEEMAKPPEERNRSGRLRIVIPTRGGDDTPLGEMS